METFATESGDLLVRLDAGELVLESIRRACADDGLTEGAVVSAIGTLRNLHVHYLHADVRSETDDRNTYLDLEGAWEVAGIQGIIADGQPHLHLMAYDGDRTIVGHLEEGNEVNALAEILIRDLGGPHLTRRPDEHDVATLEER